MRQIEIIVNTLARLIFNKDVVSYEITDEATLTETDLLYTRLRQLIDRGKICEAEDLLYDNIDTDCIEDLRLAVDFYQRINKFSDAELEKFNFPRNEIVSGLREIAALFEVDLFLP